MLERNPRVVISERGNIHKQKKNPETQLDILTTLANAL
jgi:hypothetical protein